MSCPAKSQPSVTQRYFNRAVCGVRTPIPARAIPWPPEYPALCPSNRRSSLRHSKSQGPSKILRHWPVWGVSEKISQTLLTRPAVNKSGRPEERPLCCQLREDRDALLANSSNDVEPDRPGVKSSKSAVLYRARQTPYPATLRSCLRPEPHRLGRRASNGREHIDYRNQEL